jgi:hypothetical protein
MKVDGYSHFCLRAADSSRDDLLCRFGAHDGCSQDKPKTRHGGLEWGLISVGQGRSAEDRRWVTDSD